ncbi:MAG TPA: fumarylacetoacetase [Luteitalea sp.]|nr:fumarylacetoacetase [Luteitalea sp.]
MTNHTHDPAARSWIASANVAGAFDVRLLPYAVFSTADQPGHRRLGVGIGDQILDLGACARQDICDGMVSGLSVAMQAPSLNPLLALTPEHWSALRQRLFAVLVDDEGGWRQARNAVRDALVPMAGAQMHLPMAVGDYTDFYASIHHATNVGSMLRPEQPLFPNYRYVPIGYHGRSSSIVVSGTAIRRPWGQVLPQGETTPRFGPSQRLDYELEVGLVIGGENALGEPVPVARAGERLFGMVLLNDWSARDIQAWEYQPLGPFLAKSFATSISAWVVTAEALAPRRVAAAARSSGEPELLPHLCDRVDQATGGFDVPLEVRLTSARMRAAGEPAYVVSRSNMRDLYWTPAQLIAHHTTNGCNLRPGDLLGTGTVSGPARESGGCLLERTWRGTEPLALPTGEQRRFLEDGDEVVLSSAIVPVESRGRVAPGE